MVDWISLLPDEILCHILSFLPTQDTVATSILSKRWKPLWRSVPTLFFDDESYLVNHQKPYDHFHDFIDTTVHARDSCQPIRSFRLRCVDSDFDFLDSDLDKWVKAAIQHGVENLHIELTYAVHMQPSSLSTIVSCKTLVVLKLVQLYVDVLSFIDLPSLKTLDLKNVGFIEPQYLVKFLSGCPILEYIHIRRIYGDDGYTPSYKNFKSLSKLVRADLYQLDINIPLKAICNVEFLGTDEYLRPHDIPVFPNLTHVELMWASHSRWNGVLSMLKNSPKLQIFALNMNTDSADVVWVSPYFVPECLSSQLRKCSITNYDGMSGEQHFAKYIMQNSGVLQTMTINTWPSSKLQDKFEMIKELSSCPRSSTICELLFT